MFDSRDLSVRIKLEEVRRFMLTFEDESKVELVRDLGYFTETDDSSCGLRPDISIDGKLSGH